jgi:hypothetical protein
VPIYLIRSFCEARRESTGGKGGTGVEFRGVGNIDEFATLPKSISFGPKPGWTSDSYNFLPNVEEETSACWFVGGRNETPGSAVNGL